MSNDPNVPLYQEIVARVVAMRNCKKSGNEEWYYRHDVALRKLCTQYLPSGSGLDAQPAVNIYLTTDAKLLIECADFHHMDEHGGYDGWSNHDIIVTPSLQFGMGLRVTGRDRNGVKEYIRSVFYHALMQPVDRHFGYPPREGVSEPAVVSSETEPNEFILCEKCQASTHREDAMRYYGKLICLDCWRNTSDYPNNLE